MLVSLARRAVSSEHMRSLILSLIVLNALCMGFEAIQELADALGGVLLVAFAVSQTVFVIEIGLRIAAHWPHPGRFFHDSWDRFDFLIVAASLVPAIGGFTLVARLLQVLRVLRVFSAVLTLRGFFTVDDGDPPLTVVGQALAFLTVGVYIFALTGFHLFGTLDPGGWGDLAACLASLAALVSLVGAPAVHAGLSAAPLLGSVFLLGFYAMVVITLVQMVRCLRAAPRKPR